MQQHKQGDTMNARSILKQVFKLRHQLFEANDEERAWIGQEVRKYPISTEDIILQFRSVKRPTEPLESD
jgi:hypothetical protein